MSIKRYSELILLPTFQERLEYLRTNGKVGEFTFNGHRYLNQRLYQCPEWSSIRRRVILRDNGCDLGLDGYEIVGRVIIHHINSITVEDILERDPCVFDLENLITTSHLTHNAIHYQSDDIIPIVTIRKKNDTCLWR